MTTPRAISEYIEGRLREWKQSTINRHGDQLSLSDFMGDNDLDDLIDFVCDEEKLKGFLDGDGGE